MVVGARNIGPSLKVSFIVLGAGIAIAIAGGVGTAVTFGKTILGTDAVALPAHLQRHFSAGTYEVYQRTGTRGGGGGFTFSNDQPATLQPTDVVVVGPDGSRLATNPTFGATETITRGSGSYTGVVTFDVTTSGDYTVDIAADGGLPEAVVTRSIGSAAHAAAKWIVLLVLGALAAAIGLVLLIVGIVRRNRASQPGAPYAPGYGAVPAYGSAPGYGAPPTYAATPPPAWYPDPGGSGRQRWWDGNRWTDHLN
jgi:hypothetical protein